MYIDLCLYCSKTSDSNSMFFKNTLRNDGSKILKIKDWSFRLHVNPIWIRFLLNSQWCHGWLIHRFKNVKNRWLNFFFYLSNKKKTTNVQLHYSDVRTIYRNAPIARCLVHAASLAKQNYFSRRLEEKERDYDRKRIAGKTGPCVKQSQCIATLWVLFNGIKYRGNTTNMRDHNAYWHLMENTAGSLTTSSH